MLQWSPMRIPDLQLSSCQGSYQKYHTGCRFMCRPGSQTPKGCSQAERWLISEDHSDLPNQLPQMRVHQLAWTFPVCTRNNPPAANVFTTGEAHSCTDSLPLIIHNQLHSDFCRLPHLFVPHHSSTCTLPQEVHSYCHGSTGLACLFHECFQFNPLLILLQLLQCLGSGFLPACSR